MHVTHLKNEYLRLLLLNKHLVHFEQGNSVLNLQSTRNTFSLPALSPKTICALLFLNLKILFRLHAEQVNSVNRKKMSRKEIPHIG